MEINKKIELLANEMNKVKDHLDLLERKIEELKKNKNNFEPTSKDWKPKNGEKFFVASQRYEVVYYGYEKDYFDKLIKYNRIFKTKEECQLYCDIQRAFREASKEFDYGKDNYYLYCGMTEKRLFITLDSYCKDNNLYFDSREIIQNLIDKFGEENIKRYYLGVY